MATGLDRAAGYCMMLLSALIFTYYSIWVIVLCFNHERIHKSLVNLAKIKPFVEKDHVIHQAFLPRMYAIIIPVIAGVILLGVVGLFAAVVILKSKKPELKKTD